MDLLDVLTEAGLGDPGQARSESPASSEPAVADQSISDEASTEQPATSAQADAAGGPSAGAISPKSAQRREAAWVDWLERDQLSPDALAAIPPYCAGAYQEPALPADVDPESPTVSATADHTLYDIGKTVVLDGHVMFRHRNSQMATDRATYDAEGQTMHLEGEVSYRQPGMLILGEDARMVLEPRSASVDNASFVLHRGRSRGRAESVTQEEDGTLVIRSGYLTRCDPGDNTWALSTSRITIDADRDFATARNAVLRVEDVPVFYIPYLKFPVSNRRHTGFLFPTVGSSGKDGIDLTVPYYWNLAPDYDATITPRWMSNRGVLLELETRHLSRAMRNTLGGAFMREDDNYDGMRSRGEFRDLGLTGPFNPADRWLLNWQHEGRFGPVSSMVDYSAVSDLDYFNDLGTNLEVTSGSQLARRAELVHSYGLSGGDVTTRLSALRVQPLQVELVDPYRKLPDLSLDVRQSLQEVPLAYSLNAQATKFERDNTDLTGVDRFNGSRWHVEPRVSMPLRTSYGHLTPTLAWRHTGYDIEDAGINVNTRPSRSVGSVGVDGGLIFERDVDWFAGRTVQTLEPRVQYLYVQREAQDQLPLFDTARLTFDYAQLFRENRFSGLDRVNDANQLSLAVTTRFLNADTGVERLQASAGRIVHFRDRAVTLDGSQTVRELGNSPWAGEVTARIAADWSLHSAWVFDARERVEDSGRIRLQYAPPPRYAGDQRLANVSFNRSGTNIREASASAYWPIGLQWRGMGRWYYDFERNRTLEAFAGIEYDACCYRLRVLARRYLKNGDDPFSAESNSGVFLQIVFKGLAGIGGGVDQILENGIPGYQEEKYELN